MYCHFALIPKITLGELQSRFFYCIKFDCRTKIKKHKNNVLNCGRSTRYSMAEAVRFELTSPFGLPHFECGPL